MFRRCAYLAIAGLVAVAGVPSVSASEHAYPNRPIALIVPWGPGGGADQTGRKIAQLLSPILGVSIPVLNVPGATGMVGLNKLLTAPSDGYTLEVLTGDTYALLAGPKPKFKANDILTLGIVMQLDAGFFVREDSPWKTWNDVVQAARLKPLTVAVTGFGSLDDITVNYFRAKGLRLVAVPYAKPTQRSVAVIGGHADLLYQHPGDIRNLIEGKQLRPVLFFANHRLDGFPAIPVAKELGYEITLPQLRGIMIRKGTDIAISKRLGAALQQAVEAPEFKAFLKQDYAAKGEYLNAARAPSFLRDWLIEIHHLLAISKSR